MFNLGDKVKVVSNTYRITGYGTIGQVVEIKSDRIYIEVSVAEPSTIKGFKAGLCEVGEIYPIGVHDVVLFEKGTTVSHLPDWF